MCANPSLTSDILFLLYINSPRYSFTLSLYIFKGDFATHMKSRYNGQIKLLVEFIDLGFLMISEYELDLYQKNFMQEC